jgi:hypothetical protein
VAASIRTKNSKKTGALSVHRRSYLDVPQVLTTFRIGCSNPEHGNVIFDPVGQPERSGKDQENQADETERQRKVAGRGTDLRALGK